ncbi:MAG: peptidoglycan-binding protein [Alphaproteobacteria bacterium]|nr:peptidoglycan-binding protein [Alphaproteobacteria bacterium]
MKKSNPLWCIPIWKAVCGAFLVVFVLAVSGPAQARAPTDLGNSRTANYDPLVERIQKALATFKLYRGSIHGRINEATREAIRRYQKSAGFEVNGKVSAELADHMETGRKVDQLLQKLDRTREENTEAARRALLSNPATKALMETDPLEAADPTRDFSACFQNPTVACLLAESSESAKAVAKDELRDWALGEILVVQARAGLAGAAMESARRIGDPRLVMVALRDIAEALAKAGRVADAVEAAGIIPDPEKQAEAFAAIAAALTHCGATVMSTALDRLNAAIDRVGKKARRVPLVCRGATILAQSGAPEDAAREIERAETLAKGVVGRVERSAAYRHVALALAEMGDPERALDVLGKGERNGNHMPVLVAAANAQADAGDPERALETASAIETARYRAVVLSRIALAQAKAGDPERAIATIGLAFEKVAEIELPFARDFANSRISLALASIARESRTDGFARAIEKTNEIADNRLRAHTLWALAADQRRAGDEAGAGATRELALVATDEMKSPFSRVWMFGDIGMRHAALEETDAGWAAFADGMKLASDIHNAWARSRAISRMAATMIELSEPLSCRPRNAE